MHNEINAIDALTIPDVFKPIRRKTLCPLWSEIRRNFSFFQDIAINIFGFIPFGFFFSALLLKTTRLGRILVYLIIFMFGTGLSFAIELIQVNLPTRDPSLIDVAMNSTGTILGAAICQSLSKASVQDFSSA